MFNIIAFFCGLTLLPINNFGVHVDAGKNVPLELETSLYTSSVKTSKVDVDSVIYLNFLKAIQRASTFNYFTVVKVKNLNTGEVKEICTKGNFLSGALHKELGAGYDADGNKKVLDFAMSRRDRYFEFKNKEALKNISFKDYNPKLVDLIQNEYDFDKVIEIIKKDEEFSIYLSKEERKAFAHVLFLKGYLTGENSCWGGALEYVNMKSQ